MIPFAVISFSIFGWFSTGTVRLNFDSLKPGTLPPNWTQTHTHRGAAPHWEIRRDPTAPSPPNVFAQASTAESEFEFPLAVFDKVICSDGDLSVKFKILPSAKPFKTAGVIWRYQDPRNYYLLHFSVDEKNIVMFRVQNGKARAVPVIGAPTGGFGVHHDVRTGQWYIARVVFRGQNFHIWFGNRQLFDAEDGGIPGAGKTGIWTKDGTIAYFDDFRIAKR